MNAEIFFLGLMMFCVDTPTENCPLVNDGQPPGRVYLVDATKDARWCEDGGCKACEHDVDYHSSYLVVSEAQIDKENGTLLGSRCIDIEEIGEACGNSCDHLKGLQCWPLAGKKVTFRIVPSNSQDSSNSHLTTRPGRQIADQVPKPGEEQAFGWVASMSYFGNSTENQLVEPGDLDPSKRLATAWVDFPDYGELQARLLGPGGNGDPYSLWKSTRRNFPPRGHAQRSALANGVEWYINSAEAFKVCDGDACMALAGNPIRAAFLNLPIEVFAGCKRSGSGHETLNHFRMYYKFFRQPGSCGAPSIAKGKPLPQCLPLAQWLKGTSSLIDSTNQSNYRVDDALCPPSKFP